MSEMGNGPYPGSRAFRKQEQRYFFGRAADTSSVADLWRTNRLTVVSGPAGCGKTSLLRAGVCPLLAMTGVEMLPPGDIYHCTTFPAAALPEHNSYILALLNSWSPGEVPSRLAGATLTDFVRHRAQRYPGPVMAAIDQAEALVIDSGSGIRRTRRRQLLAELAQAIESEARLHLLMVVRSDAVDLISAGVGNGATYAVEPLTRQGAIEAITGPMALTGRSFAAGVPEKLVDDLRDGAAYLAGNRPIAAGDRVEPVLLQAVCARLWRRLPANAAVITAELLRTYGNPETALAEHCGQVIATVAAEHDTTSRSLRSWLLRDFIADDGSRTVGEGALEAAGVPDAVARSFVESHLLTLEPRPGPHRYALLSDRLIEPLRRAPDQPLPALEPIGYLRAAGRNLVSGEIDLAQRQAERALAAGPDLRVHAGAHSLLANIAREQDEPVGAEAHYREAAALFEAAGDVGAAARQLAAMGQTLLSEGRIADAVDGLRSAVSRVPNDLVMQTALALALWQLGDGRAAVAILTGVLGVDGGNTEALRARGEILADLGEARDAMLDLERQSVRDHPATIAARGLALAELGYHQAANREIDSALHRAPRNAPVLFYAARAFALGGDKVSSRELARLALDATNPPLRPQHRKAALRLAEHG